jgi:hypothetical protein
MAPVGIRTKAPAISIFRGSITQLLYPLHTLDAAISDDSPMLASGWLPPFPGGAVNSRWVPARNFHFAYLIISFPSGFTWRYMPDSHLRRRSEALQDRSCGWFVTIALSTISAAREAMNTSTCLVWICSLRRDDNSPFFSIVSQLGTQNCITLEKIREQWRKLDSSSRAHWK